MAWNPFARKPKDASAENPYHGLRQKWIRAEWAPAEMPTDHVFAILFEIGGDDGTATILAAEDGTASIYTSRGGGMIGLGEKPPVAEAARAFVVRARAMAAQLPRVEDCPTPGAGSVSFWLVSRGGARGALAPEARVLDHAVLGPLYVAGQDLITQMRLHAPFV